jgi:hypothetical protein
LAQEITEGGDKKLPVFVLGVGNRVASFCLEGASADLFRCDRFLCRVVGLDVLIQNGDGLGDDFVALECGEQAAVDVDRGLGLLEGAG